MAAVLLWRPSGLFGQQRMMTRSAQRCCRARSTGASALALGALLLAVLPLLRRAYYVELGTYALISAMLALSLQLLVGCTGLVSLGHAAFYGLAAYTVYLITPASERPLDPGHAAGRRCWPRASRRCWSARCRCAPRASSS